MLRIWNVKFKFNYAVKLHILTMQIFYTNVIFYLVPFICLHKHTIIIACCSCWVCESTVINNIRIEKAKKKHSLTLFCSSEWTLTSKDIKSLKGAKLCLRGIKSEIFLMLDTSFEGLPLNNISNKLIEYYLFVIKFNIKLSAWVGTCWGCYIKAVCIFQ